jgi:hypothetical protein
VTEGHQIIRDGPDTFSVEGVVRRDGEQRFTSANGSKSETEARKWIYYLQAKDREMVFTTTDIEIHLGTSSHRWDSSHTFRTPVARS